MTRRMTSFYIDPDLDAGLKDVKERFGMPESEQIRRAIRNWLAHYPAMLAVPPQPTKPKARRVKKVRKKR